MGWCERLITEIIHSKTWIIKSVLGGVLLDTVTTAECKQKWVLNSGLHDSQTTLYLLRHCVVTAVVVF